jgi:hypothetical protein
MRNTTVLILFSLLATFASMAQSIGKVAGLKSPIGQVDVGYRFQDASVVLNEPIVLLFSVHNGLAEPVTLTLGGQQTQFFQFSLTTPDGRTLQSSRNPGDYVSVVVFGPIKTTVAPGADYQQPILVNEWFKFDIVGTYVLVGELTTGIETSDGTVLPSAAKTVRLQGRPRNAARLENICATLAREVEDSLSVEKWQFPARMLSSINDPIAVPYLGQVLATNSGTSYLVVPSLERIGNDAAVNVLVSALRNSSGDVAPKARQSLRRIQERTESPILKERISQVLTTRTE